MSRRGQDKVNKNFFITNYEKPHRESCTDDYEDVTSCKTKFYATIFPMTGVITPFGSRAPQVQFLMIAKKNKVTIQWEPFEGTVSQAGVSSLVVTQTISHLPPYDMAFPISAVLKGVPVTLSFVVSVSGSSNLSFSLAGFTVEASDNIIVRGSQVSWLLLNK